MFNSSATSWAVAYQAPLSMGLPRQEYRNGLPFPSPGDLPNPGIEPASPELVGEFFTTESSGKPHLTSTIIHVYYLFLNHIIKMKYDTKLLKFGVSIRNLNTFSSPVFGK